LIASPSGLTISAPITEIAETTATAVTFAGTGTTRLSATTSNYRGVTTVTGDTLEVARIDTGSANSSIGNPGNTAATNLLLGNGTTLRFIGDGGANDTTDRNWTLNGTSNGDSATLDASGAGTETVTFSNTSSPAYGTTNQTRTINLAGTNTGTNTLAARIANNGTGTVSLTKSGAGTWVLTGISTYSGVTTVTGGTLEVARIANGSANSSIGNPISTAATNLLLGNGATLRFIGDGGTNDTTDRNWTLNGTSNGDSATLDASGAGTERVTFSNTSSPAYGTTNQTRTINLAGTNTSANTLAANILNNGTGAVSLTKSGAGTWVLTGASTYTGSTTISNGILEVTLNNALGTNAAGTTVTAGATLRLTGVNYSTTEALSINGAGAGGAGGGALVSSGTSAFAGQITAATDATINAGSGTLALSGGVVKDGTTLTFKGAGGTITISGTGISGASAFSDLVVDGTTVTETVANTYNGPTTITNGGILNANTAGALPAGTRSAVSFTGSGAPNLRLGASQVAASLSSSTTTPNAAVVTLGSNTLTVGTASGTTTFTGSIGGTGGNLIKDGASTQVLSGTNGYTGTTTVSGGKLEVTGSLSGTTGVTVSNGGALLLNNNANDIIKTGAPLTVNGSTVQIGGGVSGKNQTFGSLTLSGNSTLDFGTAANGNALTFASAGTFTGTLKVLNWTAGIYPAEGPDSGSVGDGRDRWLFNAPSGYTPSQLATIEFFSDDGGISLGSARQISFGGTSYEIVPVPEPATTTLIGTIALCALFGYRERRRFAGFGKRTAALPNEANWASLKPGSARLRPKA
jgi:fibronectin-binding autotransporter adhesin